MNMDVLARISIAATLVWFSTGSTGLAQQWTERQWVEKPWAEKMFKTTEHDFGTVARGAKAEFAFTFENIYLEDAHINSVRTSCGCTSTKFPTEIIKTYQKGQIIASVDTRSFLGQKDATVTVVLDKPYPAEVLLHVHSYIRSDIVFQPGAIEFGSILQGQNAVRKTLISYAGRDDWEITSVESPSRYLTTQKVEVNRGPGRVTYELTVELAPDAPEGYLGQYLILRTNDADTKKSRVPLAVEGVIVPKLAVRPTALTLVTRAGSPALVRNLVVQGHMPFRVLEATCPDARIACTVPPDTKKYQVIPVRFTPGSVSGKTTTTIRIQTDLGNAVLNVQVHADVTADTPAPSVAPTDNPLPGAPPSGAPASGAAPKDDSSSGAPAQHGSPSGTPPSGAASKDTSSSSAPASSAAPQDSSSPSAGTSSPSALAPVQPAGQP